MIDEILDGFQELVTLADQSLTKLFNDQWPPTAHGVPARPRYANRSAVLDSTGRARQPISYRKQHMPSSHHRPPTSRRIDRPPTKVSNAQRNVPLRPSTQSWQASDRKPTAPVQSPAKRETRAKGMESSVSRPLPRSCSSISQPQSSPPIKADDLRIDVDRCDVLVTAVAEMGICKEIFAGWSAQLDLSEPRRKDPLEQSIVATVQKLNSDASAALHSSHSLLRSYRNLTLTTGKRLRDISLTKSGGPLYAASEFERLASMITSHSLALTLRVKHIQEQLRDLVSEIAKTKEQARKRALRRRIWGWLVKTFKALSLMISAGGTIFALFHPLGLVESSAIAVASMLSGAVAKLCEMTQKKYEESTFDEILVFMRDHIPESAKAAELALTSFQACHRILQVEMEVRQGKRLDWMSPDEAKRARGAWEDANARFRALVPDTAGDTAARQTSSSAKHK